MAITNGYATLAEVRAELRLAATYTADDPRLERAVESASRFVDGLTNREFFASAGGARIYSPSNDTVWIDDAPAAPTLVEHRPTPAAAWVTVSSSAYVVPEPSNGRPYTRVVALSGLTWYPQVRVTTAGWGWGSIPTAVKSATLIEAVRIFKRSDTPEGVLAGEFGATRLSRTDPDVLALLARYRKGVIG